MKMKKIIVIIVGIILIAIGYCISFIIPTYQKIEIVVPPQEKQREIYLYVRFNRTWLPSYFGIANHIKSELKELKKPYCKSMIDSMYSNYGAISFVDSNKCGVFLMNSKIDTKYKPWRDYFITPDTIYVIDNYRPVLLRYIIENDKGGYDTLDTRPAGY